MSLATIRIFYYPYSKDNWYQVGDDIRGEIIVRPVVDLEVIHLVYNLGIEDRGKISSSYLALKTKYLSNNTTFKKGQEYKFDFKIKNDKHVTFKGINLSYLMKMEVTIRHEPTHTEDANFFSRLKTKVIAESSISEIKYINFRDDRNLYIIQSKKLELKPRYKFMKFFIPGIVGLGFILFIFFESLATRSFPFWIIAIPIIILGILILTYFFVYKSLGRMQANLEQDQNGKFTALIMNDNNWRQIRQLEPIFSIIEEVVDNRGTSSTTYRKELHTAKSEYDKYPRGTHKAHFNFPSNFPPSISFGDTKILWTLNLRVTTSVGLIINYRSEFEVERVSAEGFASLTKA